MKTREFDCKNTEKYIPYFLEDDLDSDDLRYFLRHIETCEECREELTIAFLVKEGLIRLEEGNVFDLNKELSLKMDEAREDMLLRERLQLIFGALTGLVSITFAAVVVMLFLVI